MAERIFNKVISNAGPRKMFVPSFDDQLTRTYKRSHEQQSSSRGDKGKKTKKKKEEESYDLKQQEHRSSVSSDTHSTEESGKTAEDAEKRAFLGVNDTYLQVLSSGNAVTPVDEDYRAFMIQDMDIQRKRLKDHYVIVRRKVMKTPRGLSWRYSCSCNPSRERMVDMLSHCPNEDFSRPYQKCMHIDVMEQIASGFAESLGLTLEMEFERESSKSQEDRTDHTYEKNAPKINVYGMESNDHVVCVRVVASSEVTYSIVFIDFSGQKPELKCLSCQKKDDKYSECIHTKSVLMDNACTNQSDITEKIRKLLNHKPEWRSRYGPVAVSSCSIPLAPAPEEQKKNRSHLLGKVSKDGFIHLIPLDKGHCSCGASWDVEEMVEEINIFTPMDVLPGKVYMRKCLGNCGAIREYDGLEDQILNMGTYGVSHQLLRGYLRQYVTEGTTLAAYYKEISWQQIDSGNLTFSELFPYNRFRYAWYCFLDLLDIEYAYGFACPECGDNPETVVMDGVTLGIRKTFLPWKEYFSSVDSQPKTLDGSSHNTRSFINNKETAKLLKKFCISGVSMVEFRRMVYLMKIYQPSLLPLLKAFEETGATYQCPEIYRELLLCLSSSYSVCALIHYSQRLFEILEDLAAGKKLSDRPDRMIILEKECPVLSRLLHRINSTQIQDYLALVLRELLVKAQEPFRGREQHKLPQCSEHCNCSGIGCWPSLPHHCHRGDYVLDDKKKKADEKNSTCSKRGSSHPTLTPGIFTLSCVHGICYGFQLMEDVESPNVPFTLLRTRFHTAPKLIIYDNACNLHSYCMNRDPVFFRDSWFVVDRFHWWSHTGCHAGFNLSNYTQHREVNTQVAEQRNATLKKLKSMLSYMNVENFMKHLKLFVWFRSMLSLVKIAPNLPIKDFAYFKCLHELYCK